MARYKHVNHDQMAMVPVLLEEQLLPGTLEYAIDHIFGERLDLKIFDARYCKDETGRKAIDPKVLVKINIQWRLYCLVHNPEKIFTFGKTYAEARA
ncbi:MAG: hypothetical protein SV686_02825 [Thermodesulfobacteriota bacterium]|nr:hypothetical protein [Thermodesulfobacteriota bacterium]